MIMWRPPVKHSLTIRALRSCRPRTQSPSPELRGGQAPTVPHACRGLLIRSSMPLVLRCVSISRPSGHWAEGDYDIGRQRKTDTAGLTARIK
jgi:hypothetical protein